MKTKIILGLLLVAAAGLRAQAVTTNSTTLFTGTQLIPDNQPSGFSASQSVSLGSTITDISVQLDITGGFNGDLYAYLAGPNGQFAVLLNRVGVSATSANGYGNTGLNITLATSGTQGDVHVYQTLSPSYNGGGQLTGTWTADGRNVNPQAAGSVIGGTSATLGLNNLIGTNPDGVWTFFIADLSAGDQSTLQSVILNIMTVPEPQTWAMFGGGLAVLWWLRRGRQKA